VGCLVCLALIAPIMHMKWNLSLEDLLPTDYPSRVVASMVEKKFGGYGSLTLVAHSQDSAANAQLVQELADSLSHNPLVNFCEYRTEANFYRKHQFLYIHLRDLQLIHDRIRSRLDALKAARNPLWVDLQDSTTFPDTTLNLEDLEEKYIRSLRPYYGNDEGTIRILEIYPSHRVGDLTKNRALVRAVHAQVAKNPLSRVVQVEYAGKVQESVATSGMLLKEIYRIAWISAGLILTLLVVWFFRQPLIPLVAAPPLGMALVWTLGFNAFWFGAMNFFTLTLGLLLPGLAANHLTHFLSHYAEERRQGLGPDLALESAVLGTGPVITVVSIASAIAFFSLTLLPLEGLRQLGLVGGLGVLFHWIAILLFVPTLLTLLQRRQRFQVYGKKNGHAPSRVFPPDWRWRRRISWLVVVSVLLASHGVAPHFEYDFGKLTYQKSTAKGNALMEASEIPTQEPAVILTSNAKESRILLHELEQRKRTDDSRLVRKVFSLSSLLPDDQEAKLDLLSAIHSLLTPEAIASLHGTDSVNVRKIMENWDEDPITEDDLPFSLRRKFLGRDQTSGEFTFIFPSFDIDNGLQCRRFSKLVRNVALPNGKTLHATGPAIIRADMLDLSLPWMGRSIFIAVLGILLLLLIHQHRLYRAMLVMIPPMVGFFWCFSLLRLIDIPINPLSAQVFPMLVGISISGSLHFWHQYRERASGSMNMVMQRTAPTVIAASLTTMVCFTGLLFSSHPGLRSMGLMALIGMSCLLLAQLTVVPVEMELLEWRRFSRRKH
ncbi:MAG TPA: MMPL family transporter, partial [Fibrobacteraceae bacterium]|nr:MMPL family transporter [Fibrobacteraceae bacterium]